MSVYLQGERTVYLQGERNREENQGKWKYEKGLQDGKSC